MRTSLSIFCLLFFILLITACKKDFFNSIVPVEIPEHEPQLTVTANLFAEKNWHVINVKHSQGILDSSTIESIRDASVQLLEDGQIFQSFNLNIWGQMNQFSHYESDSISFLPNKTYTLQVNSPQYGSLQSSQQLPTKVPILTATYEKEGILDRYGERGDEITVEFLDPKGEKNYYVISVFAIYPIEREELDFDKLIHSVNLSPVAPILEKVRFSRDLQFSDASFDGNAYKIKLAAFVEEYKTYRDTISGRVESITIELLSVSKDYYAFWKSVEVYENTKGNIFAEPVNIYENVEGGIGIFTLNTSDSFTIEF